MMCFLLILILCSCFNISDSVIYKLNDSDYGRMPPVYQEDDRSCSPYCAVKIHVFQDSPSDLYHMILEYSEHTYTHFNHTELWWGVCVSKRCPQYISNTSVDLIESLEECLNESMVKDFGLQAKIISHRCDTDFQFNIDAADVIVAAICIVLLMLTVAGTVQELIIYNTKKKGNAVLKCFSLPRNIMGLLGPGTVIIEEARSFRVFYGARLLLIFLVIGFHCFLPYFMKAENAHLAEKAYSSIQYLCNGTVLVQPLFVLSGLLLTYSLKIEGEKSKLNLLTVAKGTFLRWIRLTPSFAVVLGIISTWLRFMEPVIGPSWQWTMGSTISDCRRDWWMVLLHMVNYVDDTRCLAETWYVASDMQLTIIALFVLVLARGWWRNLLLTSLFLASTAAIGLTTYFLDLDATAVVSPETIRNYIVVDETFIHVYQRMHGNMPSYIIGIVAGIVIHRIQKSDVKMDQYKKYGFVVWLCFLVGLPVVLSGRAFYTDAPRASILVRVVYAVLHKTFIAFLAAVVFIGTVFKLENLVRHILGWRLWVTPARLSYCAYLVHVTVISIVTGLSSSGFRYSEINIFLLIILVEVLSFAAAVPLWLMVEAPVSKLVRLAVSSLGWDSALRKKNAAIQSN